MTIDANNGLIVRVFDTEIERWKKDYPTLYANWKMEDSEIIQVLAADMMSRTFSSRPSAWHVQERGVCDDAVLGWRVGILTEDQLPLLEKK